MLITPPERVLAPTDSGILLTLMYFDIFQYPLTESEIRKSIPVESTDSEIRAALDNLVMRNLIVSESRFYCFSSSVGFIAKRKKDNESAEAIMPKAHRISQFIGAFPYIRGVYLSGSLSKGVLTEKGDIDYFILTKPERLWLARTILVVFRKLFLFNSHKYFCVNYFIDLNNLEIEDKNIFTATELFTLVPTYGRETYLPLMQENEWAAQYYPQFPLKNVSEVPQGSMPFLKKVLEKLGNNVVGNWLDTWCMRMTFRYRKKKFSGMNNTDFNVAFKTRKYVSKHHPSHFQKRVTDKLTEKIADFEEKNQLKIDETLQKSWIK